MRHARTLMIATLAACGLSAIATAGDAISASPMRKPSLELVVFVNGSLARIEFWIEVDGKPVAAIWDTTFDRLFAYYDRNGDGVLDRKESARLPSVFGVRQILWGQSMPTSAPPQLWSKLDRDRDGKATRDECVAYYRNHGLGSALVGVGRPQSTTALTATLLKNLDGNGDGTVSESEWKAARSLLRKLDQNDDELIGPGELIAKVSYPGAMGANLIRPPSTADKPGSERNPLPFLLLPADERDTSWATVVLARCDRDRDGKLDATESGLSRAEFAGLDANRDGKLSAVELVAWRKGKPAQRYAVRLGKHSSAEREGGPAVSPTSRLSFDVRTERGRMLEAVAASRRRFLDRFTEADQNADSLLEEKEVSTSNQYPLKQLFHIADSNEDGKLSRKELTAWLDLQDQIASGHVLLTLLDFGEGLFELLDADHDGSLSGPELHRAWDRVSKAGCIADGKFQPAKLPRQVLMTVSQGHPKNALASARREGPAWFRAMDRNGDGYVSPKEFLAPAEQFSKLDANGDGWIDAAEARKAKRATASPGS